MKKRCAIYIRVSTEEQHLNGLSLPAQRKVLTEYAIANDYTIVGYYADEGISARKSMKYRKGLLTLLEDVKNDRIDMILVTKLDRWFRNIKDYNVTEEILQAHNCYWKTIFENYDSSTANGQMVINIMLSVNQAECDRTSERIKSVLDYKRSIGEVVSGRCACYGYRVENKRLVKDEAVSHIIDDAYMYYFSCYSIRQTARYLTEKYGDLAPSVYKIDRLFKNETYAGIDGDDHNYCEPYITPEQLETARRITRSKVCTGSHTDYIFSSLIKCPICGNNYTGHRKKQTLKNGNTSIYIKYRCGNKYNRHPGACLTEHNIEEYMIAHVPAQLKQELAVIQSAPAKRTANVNPAAVQSEIDRLNILFQKGRITEAYYDSQYELLSDKLRQLHGQTDSTLKKYQRLQQTFSGDWLSIYRSLDRAHKNAFWKGTIKSIEIDPETRKLKGFQFL